MAAEAIRQRLVSLCPTLAGRSNIAPGGNMKRISLTLLSLAICLLLALSVLADPIPTPTPIPPTCNTIQSGLIVYPSGHYLEGQSVPYTADDYGYRYWNGKAGAFVSSFVNSELGFAGFPPYTGDYQAYIAANPGAAIFGDPEDPSSFWALKDLTLSIRWNDAYRSHTDCDDDGWFDRHYGFASYVDSGAWYYNRAQGYYAGEYWDTYSMVEAVPANATLSGGLWYVDGIEFGYDTGEYGMAGTLDIANGVQLYP
jgi:hypothetical protein